MFEYNYYFTTITIQGINRKQDKLLSESPTRFNRKRLIHSEEAPRKVAKSSRSSINNSSSSNNSSSNNNRDNRDNSNNRDSSNNSSSNNNNNFNNSSIAFSSRKPTFSLEFVHENKTQHFDRINSHSDTRPCLTDNYSYNRDSNSYNHNFIINSISPKSIDKAQGFGERNSFHNINQHINNTKDSINKNFQHNNHLNNHNIQTHQDNIYNYQNNHNYLNTEGFLFQQNNHSIKNKDLRGHTSSEVLVSSEELPFNHTDINSSNLETNLNQSETLLSDSSEPSSPSSISKRLHKIISHMIPKNIRPRPIIPKKNLQYNLYDHTELNYSTKSPTVYHLNSSSSSHSSNKTSINKNSLPNVNAYRSITTERAKSTIKSRNQVPLKTVTRSQTPNSRRQSSAQDFDISSNKSNTINIDKNLETPRILTNALTSSSTNILKNTSETPTVSLKSKNLSLKKSILHEIPRTNLKLEKTYYPNIGYEKLKLCGNRGLMNIGNTCFMNATFQCLSNIPELRDYFISQSYKQDLNKKSRMKGKIAEEFGKVICELWNISNDSRQALISNINSYDDPVDMHSFKNAIGDFAHRFSGYGQQDAQEFLRFLLDGLEQDLDRVIVKPPYVELDDINNETDLHKSDRWWKSYTNRTSSKITDLFLGQLKSELTCRSCLKKRSTFDPFMDLSVDLPTTKSFSLRSTESSIYDCLELFTQEEILSNYNQVYCPYCKSHHDFRKKLSIMRLPPVLVIHLKRFSNNRRKILDEISFPLDNLNLSKFLDTNEFIKGKPIYQLQGVVNHIGGLSGGHYTANCKHPETDKWRLFNDSHVKETSTNSLISNQSYLLFYTQKYDTFQ